MDNHYLLSKFEAVCLILIVTVNKLVLNIPYYMISIVGTGALVNVVYVGILDLLLTLLLVKLFDKFQNSDIIDISEYLGGKTLKWINGIASITVLFIVSFITLSDFTNILQRIYFSDFSLIYILIFFIIGIGAANLLGLRSIARTACFLIPITLISIIITFVGVWDDLHIENFTPILGHDLYTTFIKGSSNCFAMYIITYYYFIKPLLKNVSDYKKIVYTSYGISWFLIVLTIIPIMTLFNVNVTTEPINSLYLISRKIELGNFLQRIDAIFIFLWLISIFCYLSLTVFMINRIIKKLINVTDEKMLTFSTSSILFGLALIPLNVARLKFFEDTLYRYMMLILIYAIGIALMILANLKFKWKEKKKNT